MPRWIAMLLAVFAVTASAQPRWPERPVRFIVPFTPGGNADVVARTVAQGMSEALRQAVAVENRPGANAMVGAEATARATPDGYTVMLATAESHAINPHIYKRVPYDAIKDFAAVGVIGRFPFALVINPKLAATSVGEFVDLVRRTPGQGNFASWGVGSTSQIAFEQFRQVTGTQLVHVPFQGAAPAITALAGGQVDAFMVPLAVAVPQAKSGRVRLLGVTTAQRTASNPEIPTLTEQGVPVVSGGWHVIVAPRQTPPAAITQLNAALNTALAGRELREALQKQGIEPVGGTPQEADRMLQAEWARWGKVARDAGVSAD